VSRLYTYSIHHEWINQTFVWWRRLINTDQRQGKVKNIWWWILGQGLYWYNLYPNEFIHDDEKTILTRSCTVAYLAVSPKRCRIKTVHNTTPIETTTTLHGCIETTTTPAGNYNNAGWNYNDTSRKLQQRRLKLRQHQQETTTTPAETTTTPVETVHNRDHDAEVIYNCLSMTSVTDRIISFIHKPCPRGLRTRIRLRLLRSSVLLVRSIALLFLVTSERLSWL